MPPNPPPTLHEIILDAVADVEECQDLLDAARHPLQQLNDSEFQLQLEEHLTMLHATRVQRFLALLPRGPLWQ